MTTRTLVYWSEFHVKLFDIPYAYILFNSLQNDISAVISNFAKDISSIYYLKFIEKILNKMPNNIRLRDIMWYFGEIVVCNLYDKNNTYIIPQEILVKYESKFLELYNAFINCISFNDFVANVSELHRLFSQ